VESIISKMDKKVRFIFIGLIGLLLVSSLFLFSTIASKQALMREYTDTRESLTKENEVLVQKVNLALEDKRRLSERLSVIEKDLERVAKEKSQLEKKYELSVKEKGDLIEQLREKKVQAVAETAAPAGAAEDAYWAGILKEKVGLEMQIANLKKEADDLRIVLEEAKRDKATMDLEVSSLTRDKGELDNRVTYTEKITDSLSSELVREKKEKRKFQEELGSLKNEHLVLLRQLKSLSNQKASLEQRLSDTELAKADLDKRIKDMSEMLEYKLTQVMDVKEDLQQIQQGTQLTPSSQKSSVDLPPIIVRSAPQAPSPAKYTAQVLAVNRENNFVIIDLGEQDGLKPGINFGVYRDGNKIATIEVIQTRKNVSACDIKQASGPINVGDIVR